MNSPILDLLFSLDDISVVPGVDPSYVATLNKICGITLPVDHENVLLQSNGLMGYGGYLRIFGIYNKKSVDILEWNDDNFWKFSWNGRCSKYLCFAETAWGDQYAYDLDGLRLGYSPVYLLDCLSMTPTAVSNNFIEFLEIEFIRSSREPYDTMMVEARKAFGDLDIGEHLVYSVSPLLGGTESIDNVHKMNARSAMICNGDIASQLDSGPSDGIVKSIQSYEDSSHRMRLQLTWS